MSFLSGIRLRQLADAAVAALRQANRHAPRTFDLKAPHSISGVRKQLDDLPRRPAPRVEDLQTDGPHPLWRPPFTANRPRAGIHVAVPLAGEAEVAIPAPYAAAEEQRLKAEWENHLDAGRLGKP